ncbi:hypothetical protein [Piscibacillus halophilus]|uniref:Uncharacterized protein n=1 Tax=Piscibacillus halophilus TaxID=571933 RepID=A0A1H9M943_9BACI|nr:hypothetical protein [Piscibacillus halophilus]SER20280.1 hypothetical protein SAMN05216362_1592 [Piscibacillus halophilus]
MKNNYTNLLVGLWIGFTIGFLIKSFYTNSLEWSQLVFWLIGATIGHVVIVFFIRKRG